MIIRVVEHIRKTSVKDKPFNSDTGEHMELHNVTVVWFLFIPLYIRKRLKSNNL